MAKSQAKPVTNSVTTEVLSRLRNLSLKHKLIVIIMLTCISTLLLAGVIFTAWEWASLRRAMVRDLSTQAQILGDNCQAAIRFEDTTDANAVVATIKTIPSILMACVYSEKGSLLAAYTRPGVDILIPDPNDVVHGHAFEHSVLTLAQPILFEGEEIGTILLKSSLDLMYARLVNGMAVIFAILLGSSLAAYLVSAKLQGVISSPILYLADVARLVSEKKQYAVRARQTSTDEVGLLIQAFNEMLEQIQERDSALVKANEKLEARVQERTGELTAANENLMREVAFRKKAEQVLKQRTERILHHQRTLLKLGKQTNKDLDSMIRATTQEAAHTLSIERVSVWFFGDNPGEIVCEDLYQRGSDAHESGLKLKMTDFPAYCQAIESSRILAVTNVREDPRTEEMVPDYYEPLGVASTMDVPIRLHGKMLGILCHEQVGRPREWSLEEQDFGASLADMIALQIEASERRKAEHALAKANEDLAETVRELQRSNKELQDFAYVTAHDLKAPLRGIGTLADWITSDYGDRLDDAGKQHLHMLKGRVSRMSELIDSILHYSEIGRSTQQIDRVDLNAVLAEIITRLDPPPHIRITVDENMPVLATEKVRLIQIFQNLIENAIKYMDKPEGRIDVGCIHADGFLRFHVSDNGPGINRKYFQKVFQMFQTLTRRDERESTGIGLAVVKKIVELYDGNVWIESEEGKGTTFFFTLPEQMLATNEGSAPIEVGPSLPVADGQNITGQ
jgi:signal transduction histidine kinase/HAMP domain-containing protein